MRVYAVGGGDTYEADTDDFYVVDGFFSKAKSVFKSAVKTVSKHAGTIAAVSAFIPIVGPAIGGAALAIKAANGIANTASDVAKATGAAHALSKTKAVNTFKSIPADTIVKATVANIQKKINAANAQGNKAEADHLETVKADVQKNGKEAIVGAKAVYSQEEILDAEEARNKQSRQIVINIDESGQKKEKSKEAEKLKEIKKLLSDDSGTKNSEMEVMG